MHADIVFVNLTQDPGWFSTCNTMHVKKLTNNFSTKMLLLTANVPTYFSVSSREWQQSLTMLPVSRRRSLPLATWHRSTTSETRALSGTWSSASISPPCVATGHLSPADRNVAETSSSRPGDLPCLTARRLPSSVQLCLHCLLHNTHHSTSANSKLPTILIIAYFKVALIMPIHNKLVLTKTT